MKTETLTSIHCGSEAKAIKEAKEIAARHTRRGYPTRAMGAEKGQGTHFIADHDCGKLESHTEVPTTYWMPVISAE